MINNVFEMFEKCNITYRKYEVVICNLLNYGMSRNSEVMAVFHVEK